MATKHDPGKDISFLLAVAHNLTITTDFAANAIAKWRKCYWILLGRTTKTNDLKLLSYVLRPLMAKD